MSKPTLLFFEQISDQAVGGKAKGLAELTQLGFNVPAGFVIQNAKQNVYPDDLAEAYEKIGSAKVAVRSSALGEDAADNSFAGQYETILNVQGLSDLQQAINDCVASLDAEHAAAYQAAKGEAAETTMCVVVQQMVDAKAAGVLFTVDPVSGRHDRLVIDAVEGLGEALVSGETTPDHYEMDESGKMTRVDLAGEHQILEQKTLHELWRASREGAKKMGRPLDMEWATNADGEVLWLQARPITTVGSDLRELDDPIRDHEVLTRSNVSEIIPGACCPLTLSTQVRAFSKMLELLLNGCSGRKPSQVPPNDIGMPYSQGYLFVNLSAQVDVARYSALYSAENTALPICGRVVDELKEPVGRKNIISRILAIRHFYRYVADTKSNIAEFAQAFQSFYIPYKHTVEAMYQSIDDNLSWLYEANRTHGHSSCRSGTFETIMQNVISKGKKVPTADEQAIQAKVLAGAQSVESALLVEQMDALVDLIAEHPKAREKFADVDVDAAIKWLNSKAAGPIRNAYLLFLENHGHRGYRELELMTPSWVDDQVPLVEPMQASVHARFQGLGSTKATQHFDLSSQPWLVRFLAPKAHDAIRGREQTKSLLVKTTHYFKRAYRYLGELMQKKKLLEQAEDVFFLMHDELGAYILADDRADQVAAVKEKIRLRKLAFEFQEKLEFSELVVGKPEPLEQQNFELQDGEMQGRPVSKGVVEGVARVAMNVREAAELQPGEILIAPITDVAWTPYFSLIAGLATDVGSAVSHGAVIAREYGLPCIVNLQGATSVFSTGDRVRLNAETGVLSKLDAASEEQAA
ncbi:MAG: pyruvate, water dikinase [Pseudomonadales bacterium]|nr:pyruvate, water dikinase [Pseudomonadales bacterium]